MFKLTTTLAVLCVTTSQLTACMYYANFDRQRAETEQTRQRTGLIEAYGVCLKANAAEPERCPKPVY